MSHIDPGSFFVSLPEGQLGSSKTHCTESHSLAITGSFHSREQVRTENVFNTNNTVDNKVLWH